jgi:hypothetical protein
VITIPGQLNYEKYLVEYGYVDIISSAVKKHTGHIFDNKGDTQPYSDQAKMLQDELKKYMKRMKVDLAIPVAREIVEAEDETMRIPPIIKELFEKLGSILRVE